MKIYKKITLAFIITSLIAIALISITSYLIAGTSLATQVMKHLESVASIQNDRLEILFDHNLEKLALVSSRTQLRLSLKDYIRDPQPRYQDKMNRILRDTRSSIKNFKDISVLTLDGKVVASTDLSRIGTIHIDEQYFIRGQRGSVGDIFYLDKNKDLMMHLAGPLILQNKILGVIEVTVKMQAITSMVTDYSELGETGYTIIVKKVSNGEKFIRSPHRIKDKIPCYTLVDYNDLDQVSRKALLKDGSTGGNLIDSRGESVLVATRYCEKYDMGLGVRINSTEALFPINRLRNSMILIILFSFLSIIIVSILISRSITEPIVRLTDVAGRISEGDLKLKADAASKDEIGMLAQSFNKMVENLKRDITKRKQAEEKIKEYSENLEHTVRERTKKLRHALYDTEEARDKIDGILKSVADGLIVTDMNNNIVLMNRAAEDLLGVRFSEVIDRPINVAIKDETLRQRFKTSLEEREPGYQFDFELPGENSKHPRIIRARTSEIKDKSGKQTGIVTIIHDVTLEREVDRMKTEFLSTAAHQLRTPLTSIQGFSEILMTRDNIKKEQQREFLSHINEQSVNLANIINDLLDISRIESGIEFTLHKVSCDINEIIRKTVKYFQVSEPERQFDIILPKEPLELMVDKEKIGQVLENLLGNAVKYSPEGGAICLTAKKISEAEIEISVADQGMGMSLGQVEKIFDKFYRVDTSDAAISGTGLGMSIVKNYVEAHGGKVRVESELGKGTTVKFVLQI